jgi:Leucine-rich repeat (LRR) protein
LDQLRKLPNVEHINIAHNQLRELNLEAGGFDKLKKLNLSFNMIEYQYVNQLTLLPSLVDLDLSYNDLEELPESLQNFTKLKKLNL